MLEKLTTAWEEYDFETVPDYVDLPALYEKLCDKVEKKEPKDYEKFIASNLRVAVESGPGEEVVEVKTQKIYVFKSKVALQKVVRSTGSQFMDVGQGIVKKVMDPSRPKIVLDFKGKTFTLTEGFANEYGMTIEDMYKIITAHPDYKRDFICITTCSKEECVGYGLRPDEVKEATSGGIKVIRDSN